MNKAQKARVIQGASAILKGLVSGASKGGKKKSSTTSKAPAPAKKPCGACGGNK